MAGIDAMMKLWDMPNAQGRDGIHISAQLRIDAMQLTAHRIAWAALTMDTAAAYIDELEDRAALASELRAALNEALGTGLKTDIPTIERLAAVAAKTTAG